MTNPSPSSRPPASVKELKLQEKNAAQQRQIVSELHSFARDIERCEKTITSLKAELETINSKHQGRRTTREDIAYLTDLLGCAKKKLAWEKQMGSLQKRAPELIERINRLMNDPQNPPADETRAEMLEALQQVQGALERLDQVKVT